ncbi:MAG TPA: thioredoxin domain-containing protein [Sphingomonas sp.]|nr:thioredoxin domain-containing protein [Sphingomonas sp.]
MTKAHLLALGAVALALAGCDKGADNAAAPAKISGPIAPPAGQDWRNMVSRTADGFVMGNPNAPVKLVEYGSRSCPHCAKFDEEGAPQLRDKYVASGRVSYEFRDYAIHGPIDVPAIILGRCGDPSTYFPMLDQMMRNQNNFLSKASSLDQAKLTPIQNDPVKLASVLAEQLGYLDFVRQRGVSESAARACLADKSAYDAMVKTMQKANALPDFVGTPTFLINDQKLDNVGTWEQLEPKLKEAGA